MNDNKQSIWSWLNLATAGIRFGPDREAVRAELTAHLEDKTADFQRIFPGMTLREAQDRAVAGMGDPVEIGKELVKIHKPWLGYLWVASRWLARIALALSAVLLLFSGPSPVGLEDLVYRWQSNREAQAVTRSLYGDGKPGWEVERLALWRPELEERLGRCTLTVDEVALWRGEDGADTLYINLRLDYDRPWERQWVTLYYFQAEDDLGGRYDLSYTDIREGLSWVEVNLRLENVPAEARAVHVSYLPGTGLDLVLDLTREGAL